MAHAWEPLGSGVVQNQFTFPAYAAGYNLIDAIYQGMPYLAWQNVVVGDPLTRIFNYEVETLTSNTTLSNTTVKKKIIVPAGITLTLSGTVNIERNSQILVSGNLVVADYAVVTFSGFSYLNTTGINIADNVTLTFKNKSRFVSAANINVGSGSIVELRDNAYGTMPSLVVDQNTFINLYDNSSLNLTGDMRIENGSQLQLASNCSITGDQLFFQEYSSCNLSGLASLDFEKVFVSPGCTLNLNGNSSVKSREKLVMDGSSESKININSDNVGQIYFDGVDTLHIANCIFSGAYVNLNIAQESGAPATPVEVTNCNFKDSQSGISIVFYNDVYKSALIENCNFENIRKNAIQISEKVIATIRNSTITSTLDSEGESGIMLGGNFSVVIDNVSISQCTTGVNHLVRGEVTENLSEGVFTLINSNISNCEIGISLNYDSAPLNSIRIEGMNMSENKFNILLGNYQSVLVPTRIINNQISRAMSLDDDKAIEIINCSNVQILDNEILNHKYGIHITNVQNYSICRNNITSSQENESQTGFYSHSSSEVAT